jgi:hypothetical protein
MGAIVFLAVFSIPPSTLLLYHRIPQGIAAIADIF